MHRFRRVARYFRWLFRETITDRLVCAKNIVFIENWVKIGVAHPGSQLWDWYIGIFKVWLTQFGRSTPNDRFSLFCTMISLTIYIT